MQADTCRTLSRTHAHAQKCRLVERGIVFAFGTDNLMTNTPDMLEEMQFVVRDLMARYKGRLPISPERLLLAATRDAARMLHKDRVGLIAEGYAADLVLLSKNENLTPFKGAISILLRASSNAVRCVIKQGILYKI
jgi:cytosine/adenosine deaminase-related metal-dependent hydrolase